MNKLAIGKCLIELYRLVFECVLQQMSSPGCVVLFSFSGCPRLHDVAYQAFVPVFGLIVEFA